MKQYKLNSSILSHIRGFLLSILVMSAAFPLLAATNGTIGSNLSYTIDDNGKLTISGKGDMYYKDSSPFQGKDNIK